jgi:exopolysaccharide biosynthesis protein
MRFIMSGGTITGNSGYSSGGVYNAGTFEMSGGEISYNPAKCADGVYNKYFSEFCFTGGSIVYDPSSYAGIYNSGAFTMSGGAVITGTNDTKDILLLDTSTINLGSNLTVDDHILAATA